MALFNRSKDDKGKEKRRDFTTVFYDTFSRVVFVMLAVTLALFECLYLVPVLTAEIAGATGIGYDSDNLSIFVMLVMPALFMLACLLYCTRALLMRARTRIYRTFDNLKANHLEKVDGKKSK